MGSLAVKKYALNKYLLYLRKMGDALRLGDFIMKITLLYRLNNLVGVERQLLSPIPL